MSAWISLQKFGEPRSNGFRDIRGADFVSNERTLPKPIPIARNATALGLKNHSCIQKCIVDQLFKIYFIFHTVSLYLTFGLYFMCGIVTDYEIWMAKWPCRRDYLLIDNRTVGRRMGLTDELTDRLSDWLIVETDLRSSDRRFDRPVDRVYTP